jgi:methylase of polypeptide subunit release factors
VASILSQQSNNTKKRKAILPASSTIIIDGGDDAANSATAAAADADAATAPAAKRQKLMAIEKAGVAAAAAAAADGTITAKQQKEEEEEEHDYVIAQDAQAVHVASLQYPVLVSDYAAIARQAPSVRDTVLKLMIESARRIEYGPVSYFVDRRRFRRVWAPNIDTLLLCHAIGLIKQKQNNKAQSFTGSCIEVGCGNGFVSQYLLSTMPHMRSLQLVDTNRECIACSKSWIHDTRASFAVMSAADWFASSSSSSSTPPRKVDMIVANPPYIPYPVGGSSSTEHSSYAGLELLLQLLDNRRDYLHGGGKLIVNVSSVCLPIVLEYLNKKRSSSGNGGGSSLTALQELPDCELVCERTVPFKVFNVLNNKAWLASLLQRKLLLLRDAHATGYQFWQTIGIFCFTV